jgi:hypothetical protein
MARSSIDTLLVLAEPEALRATRGIVNEIAAA